jgi:acetyl-CoA carboxylase biotin carboxyl carrier protein
VDPKDKDPSPQVVKQAKELVQLLVSSTSVRRVSLGAGKMKIELERVFMTGEPEAAVPTAGEPPAPPDTRHKVLSPLVGTFRHQEKRGGKKLVEAGQRVEKGQAIGVIEVVGLEVLVPADVAGEVVEVLVADGQRVQYDQPLVVIETATS